MPERLPYHWENLQSQDWVQALKGVPQDPVYHAEGDVWIHTGMVVEALESLAGYQSLSPEEQAELYLATALHDIAKPICTREEDGRIISPRHALKGRLLSRQTLYTAPPISITFAQREHIGHLVRYHGLPLWILEKQDPRMEILKASQLCKKSDAT